jgi:hypothetical protein
MAGAMACAMASAVAGTMTGMGAPTATSPRRGVPRLGRVGVARGAVWLVGIAFGFAGCTTGGLVDDRPEPAAVRAQLRVLLPENVRDRDGWATDIERAFTALSLPAGTEPLCAVLAVTEQESSFVADPPVAGLPRLARAEIMKRADRLRVPAIAVRMALQIESPDSRTYDQRLGAVRTERELSEIFRDFTAMVPLGERLLAGWNPVRTGGPMQVSIEFAERHAREHRYPYDDARSIRDEVFTRRGGLYFGIAHLLGYPAEYDAMRFRFADFNAGHYASRNAAFQRAVARATGRRLAIDGDLVRHGAPLAEPGETEAAVRTLADRLGMSDAEIRRELERGDSIEFDRSALREKVFALAEQGTGKRLPRASMPDIRLSGPKIQRRLTTAWFADRVDQRYRRCLARADP